MKNFTSQLEDFSFEKLEERKEFTFYYTCGEVKHESGCDKSHSQYDDCKPAPKDCSPGGTPV